MTLSILPTFTTVQRKASHKHWVEVAHKTAEKLRADVVERDSANLPPFAAKKILQDSGLLPLNIPRSLGGEGLNLHEAFELVQIIARADNSTGQLLGYHYLFQVFPYLDIEGERAQQLATDSITNRWLFSSTGTPQGSQVQAQRVEGGYIINGLKPFATGSRVADQIFARVFTAEGDRIALLVDTTVDGVVLHDDWDVLGSRGTATNSIEFRDVFVAQEAVIADVGPTDADREVYKTLSTLGFQLLFSTVYLAAAEGAFLEALGYTRDTSRPWFHADVQKATDDPYIVRTYGELASKLQALSALVQQATDSLDWLISQGKEITLEQRSAVAENIVAAKITAHEVSLEVTQRVFDVTGARATKTELGLDRHWRDVRTHTLHDPVAYKCKELGAYLLNGELPVPSAYQ